MSSLPPVLTEIIQEYAGGFRVKEDKIDVWVYNAITDIDSEIFAWERIGTYFVTPGIWHAVYGPFVYEPRITYIPLILHAVNFDVSTLPPLTISTQLEEDKEMLTGHDIIVTSHIPSKEGKTTQSCEGKMLSALAIAPIIMGAIANPIAINRQTWIITDTNKRIAAIILMLGRQDREIEVYRKINEYERARRIREIAGEIQNQLGQPYEVFVDKNKQLIIMDTNSDLRITITPSGKIWGPLSRLSAFTNARAYEKISQASSVMIDRNVVQSRPQLITLYQRIMEDMDTHPHQRGELIIDNDHTYHMQ